MPTSRPIPFLVALLTLPISTVDAQAIRGVVVDEGIRASPSDSLMNPGIEGAEIEMTREGGEAGLRTLTDSLGNFFLAAPEAGVFSLRVSH
ncbi:MAG: carboxypeptidase-like regulatory domain-containing protein, partial [Longimicrobiales bacterium]